jgi:hypothetical protein
MDSSRYPGRTDRRAEEPDAATDNAERRQRLRAAEDAIWIYLCDIPQRISRLTALLNEDELFSLTDDAGCVLSQTVCGSVSSMMPFTISRGAHHFEKHFLTERSYRS